ncbi:redox-sensitive bicupin YhaK (pirin superfamily) [Bradyrhizobium sp. USDA 4369]
MSLIFSPLLTPQTRGPGRPLSVQSFDLHGAGFQRSPIVMFDDFRVNGHPFAPHPHAGFSAVTYVFDDSPGRLRSRDSLGGDYVVGRGGIVWTQAAHGVMHEELPADRGAELHGLQFFVNLTGANKAIAPQVFALDGNEAPVWTGGGGDRVKVVVGDYRGVVSPLHPAEPFQLLDVQLSSRVELTSAQTWFGVIYARYDAVEIVHSGGAFLLPAGSAIAVEGVGDFVLNTIGRSRPLYLAGPAVNEAVLQHGPFIMRDPAEIEAAMKRHERGEMGSLAPYRA